jgi:hypothetical protein
MLDAPKETPTIFTAIVNLRPPITVPGIARCAAAMFQTCPHRESDNVASWLVDSALAATLPRSGIFLLGLVIGLYQVSYHG